MDRLVVQGGERLRGELRVSGAKNATLPVLAAAILADGVTTVRNVPELRDIATMLKLLEGLGAGTVWDHQVIRVDASTIHKFVAAYDLVRTMRASVVVLGPLLARFGRAQVSLPGGCAIGARPINLHLKGLEAMGARLELKGGYVEAKAKRLRGAEIYLDTPSVGATENLLMAATLARGRTVIENAAREPEIADLAAMLVSMGADIHGAGTGVITVEGVAALKAADHAVIPDRIEAGTFMIAAAITRGDVLLRECVLGHMDAIVGKLREAGVEIEGEPGGVRVRCRGTLRAADARTEPYPGFPTDMQAQFMALMAVAEGQGVITETVFENRFMHVSELRRLGADVRCTGSTAVVRGVEHLIGAPTMATDLRASACLVLAGLVARGETEISRVYHLDRGYESIERKLRKLGADIRRITE